MEATQHEILGRSDCLLGNHDRLPAFSVLRCVLGRNAGTRGAGWQLCRLECRWVSPQGSSWLRLLDSAGPTDNYNAGESVGALPWCLPTGSHSNPVGDTATY